MLKFVGSNQVVVEKSAIDEMYSAKAEKWDAINLDIIKKRQKREATFHILSCVLVVGMIVYIGVMIRAAIVNNF